MRLCVSSSWQLTKESYCGDGSERGGSRVGGAEAGSRETRREALRLGNETQNMVRRLGSGREMSALVFIKDLRF